MTRTYCTILTTLFVYVASVIAPAGAAGSDDPCAISKAVVGAAMGMPVTKTTSRAMGDLNSCTFHTAKLLHYASISTSREDSVDAAKSFYQHELAATASIAHETPTQEAGIGDEAAEIDGLLYVRKGTALYHFTVIDGTPQPQPLAKAIKIAKAVMPAVKP